MEDSDIFNRIFDKLDSYEERLDTTCNTMTEIKITLHNFIEALEKKEEKMQENIENRYKKITSIFGTITIVSVLIGIIKSLGVF